MYPVHTLVNSRWPRRAGVMLFLLIVMGSAPVRTALAQDDPAPAAVLLRVEGVKIKVTDLDEALAFYRDLLGFAVRSDEHTSGSVTLDGGALPLTLTRADRPARAGYAEASRTSLSLESYDLAATMASLKARGLAFLQDPPVPYGRNQDGAPLGLATRFEDPFGNILSMVEQQLRRGEAFTGIRVYNAGFRVPDVEKARAFYCGRLGFVALTERYYPNIPLGHADHSFAFMLHTEAPLRPAPEGYPETAQRLLVFSTPDLVATLKRFKKQGVTMLHEAPQADAEGRFFAFKDPFGNVSEVYERREGPPPGRP